MAALVLSLIHILTLTNSEKGKEILDHFSEYLPKFKKVIPYDYNRMQMAIVQMEEKMCIRDRK